MIMTSPASADVVTSSDKILNLASQEGSLLSVLKDYISEEYDNLRDLSAFLSARSKSFHLSNVEERQSIAEHPNGAYALIKLFTTDWANVLERNPAFVNKLRELKDSLPVRADYEGAMSAIVRLQRLYRMQVPDIYSGNYLGYLGPPLGPTDAFEVGRQAFVDGYLAESISWLELAADKQRHEALSPQTLAHTLGLLGRAYFYMNRTEDARQTYEESLALNPEASDVIQLGVELNVSDTESYGLTSSSWHDTMSELCQWSQTHRVAKLRSYHVCRYKPSLYLPYVRFQEEILSTSPYASLFYNFVSDTEISQIKNYIRGRMKRGRVGEAEDGIISPIRTSDLGWIDDHSLDDANRISLRIKAATWLEVDQRLPEGPSSSEAFQVVNYGLGGHYDAHIDPFNPNDSILLSSSGDRIATFLIYLSDVEKGGNTAFIRAGVSVAPQKGMALFWYNFNPAMKLEKSSFHAGCPVLIGHKWSK
ncbi:hypothetical protein C0Q70_03748 [Pomacea canaliculata]|uniref:procollagen-proline 4-dioxygenase n=1 Tax=Pomacea canaliculata TaxID=400727 RepID=A0A2T7PTK8_POMCA|nr:hypothetical protein C0Q70_03748 [Pomacea canaliculata]